MRLELIRASVNARSLTEESKIIKRLNRKLKCAKKKQDLYLHKINTVRPEARLTNLAIGFLKGYTKRKVEVTKKPVDIKRLLSKINKFCKSLREYSLEEVSTWIHTTRQSENES